jgi:hypothetical protein
VATDPTTQGEQYEKILSQTASLDEILLQVAKTTGIADRQFTKQEIEEARGNLSPMNDRVAMATFADNRNNDIITGMVNALRNIHNAPQISPIEQTYLQELSLPDVLGRGMIADMISEGWQINVVTEIQGKSQADFAVRGTLSSSNIMRRRFKKGDDYSEAPNTIGVYILGFNLPELEHKKDFVSRIVRADYDDGKHFLADKYSDYYIEIGKCTNWNKSELPQQLHEIWELCMILGTKMKDQERMIKMEAIQSPLALNLARETRNAVAPDEFVDETLRREQGLAEIQAFLAKGKKMAIQKHSEDMLIEALQNDVPHTFIEIMRTRAGITDARFAEIKKLAGV